MKLAFTEDRLSYVTSDGAQRAKTVVKIYRNDPQNNPISSISRDTSKKERKSEGTFLRRETNGIIG